MSEKENENDSSSSSESESSSNSDAELAADGSESSNSNSSSSDSDSEGEVKTNAKLPKSIECIPPHTIEPDSAQMNSEVNKEVEQNEPAISNIEKSPPPKKIKLSECVEKTQQNNCSDIKMDQLLENKDDPTEVLTEDKVDPHKNVDEYKNQKLPKDTIDPLNNGATDDISESQEIKKPLEIHNINVDVEVVTEIIKTEKSNEIHPNTEISVKDNVNEQLNPVEGNKSSEIIPKEIIDERKSRSPQKIVKKERKRSKERNDRNHRAYRTRSRSREVRSRRSRSRSRSRGRDDRRDSRRERENRSRSRSYKRYSRRDDSRRDDGRRDDSRRDGSRRDDSRRDDGRRYDGRRDDSRRDEGRRDDSRRDEGRRDDGRRDRSRSQKTTKGTENPENKSKEQIDSKDNLPQQRKTVDLLTSKTGGAYIPPAKLRMMQAKITDKSSMAYQRISWEALKKSIHGYINKVNVDNIGIITREIIKENIIRGRGLLCRSIIQAQAASPTFSHVYAALVSIINSKFPNIGELLLNRLIIQFKRGFRRNDKSVCISSTRFIAHLVNQRVCHEILALEILTLLVETPTDDSIEVSIAFLKECGMKLTEVSSRGISAIFEMLKNILHEGQLEKRVQYMIEVVFQVRKDGFKDNIAVIEPLELVEEDNQYTHLITLEDGKLGQEELNVFKFDENFENNEGKYKELLTDLLGSDASDSDNESDNGSDDENDSDDEEEAEAEKVKQELIIDNTETNLVALRRTIYLTIHSSLDYEECAHKLMKMQLKPGQEMELCHMFLDCCAEQRTYEKFYGLLAQRFCTINKTYIPPFEEIFKDTYHTTHRLDTNRLRNVSKFFAHLFFTDAISWDVFDCIKLNEDDTTSSSRIFIKILFQELAEYMGLGKLNAKLKDPTLHDSLNGFFPKDNPRNTRFAINFFTSIGLGGLTDDLREFLKNTPKIVPAINHEFLNAQKINSSSSSSSSDSSTGSDSSSSSESEDDNDKKRKKQKTILIKSARTNKKSKKVSKTNLKKSHRKKNKKKVSSSESSSSNSDDSSSSSSNSSSSTSSDNSGSSSSEDDTKRKKQLKKKTVKKLKKSKLNTNRKTKNKENKKVSKPEDIIPIPSKIDRKRKFDGRIRGNSPNRDRNREPENNRNREMYNERNRERYQDRDQDRNNRRNRREGRRSDESPPKQRKDNDSSNRDSQKSKAYRHDNHTPQSKHNRGESKDRG